MANCRDIESNLAPFVDGEHASLDRAAIDAHLLACPSCRNRVAAERAVHELVCARRGSLRSPAPDALRQRCAAQRALAAPRPAWRSQRGWVPVSLAASLIFVTGLVLLFGWGSSVETYAAQLAVDHLKCFQFPPDAGAAPDVTLLGRNWSEGNGWPLKVAASSATEQLQLLGVRRCGSSKGRLAHILYKWHGEPLSVYVLNTRFDHSAGAGHDHDVTRLGEHAIVWTERGRTYAVVADRRVADLGRVASYVRRAIE